MRLPVLEDDSLRPEGVYLSSFGPSGLDAVRLGVDFELLVCEGVLLGVLELLDGVLFLPFFFLFSIMDMSKRCVVGDNFMIRSM